MLAAIYGTTNILSVEMQLLPGCRRIMNKSVWVVTSKQCDIAETSGRINLGPA